MHTAKHAAMRTAGNGARILAVAALAALAGCTYTMPGKVVDGFGSAMVDTPDNPDARKGGIPGATIELIRDPDTMNRARVAQATSRADGRFDLVVDSFGAGWMEEKWLLRVRRSGYESVEMEVDLPSSTSGRLLVVGMARGRSTPFREPESTRGLVDEAKKYEPGVGNSVR